MSFEASGAAQTRMKPCPPRPTINGFLCQVPDAEVQEFERLLDSYSVVFKLTPDAGGEKCSDCPPLQH